MNLVWFLTIVSGLLGMLGEFGQFPFGSTSSVSLLDIGSVVTVGFLAIWQLGISKKLEFPKIYGWIVGFMLCGLIGAVVVKEWSGLVYLVRFGVYSLWLWVGYSLIKSGVAKITDFEKLLLISGVLLIFGGVGQMIWLPNLKSLEGFGYDPHINRMTGLFLDPNFFGALLVIVWGVCTTRWLFWKQKFDLVWMVVVSLGIVMSLSRSAYLMWLVVIVGLSLWQSKKLIVIMLAVGMVLVLTVPRVGERMMGGLRVDASASERLESWSKGVDIWKGSPVFGIGFDNIRIISEREGMLKTYSRDGGNSGAGVDSSLLLVLVTSGVVGLLFYIGFWAVVVKNIWSKRSGKLFLVVLSGLFVESWFVNSLFLPIIMTWIFLWVGMLMAKE